jgi:hypothetical protein
MTQCSLVGGYKRFGVIYCVPSQGIITLKMERKIEKLLHNIYYVVINQKITVLILVVKISNIMKVKR